MWDFLAYILETILFLITGGYLGVFFGHKDLSLYIHINDFYKVIIF